MDLSQLDGTVQFYCTKGLAVSTHKTYQSALRKFANFCTSYSIISPFPVSESILCYFAAHLASQGLSPSTIKTYLAGIRHMQITLGLPEPKEFSSLPRLRLVQAGIQRTYTQDRGSSRVKLPITPAILHKIRAHWSLKCQDVDTIMLWAAAVMCFFGFFRAGELTIPNLSAYDKSIHLSWGDVTVDNTLQPRMLKVTLKRSKTDQLGKGVDVFIGKTDCPLCPIAAVLAYMVARGSHHGPFFKFADGRALTKPKFTHHIRLALQAVGLPYNNFTGHSFRSGAATAAASAGIEDSTIRTLGRWSSSAFLVYIRTPREQLAQFSRALSNL